MAAISTVKRNKEHLVKCSDLDNIRQQTDSFSIVGEPIYTKMSES